MKDRIGFVAIGQAGGNIGRLFEERGYTVLYLNTSQEDLKTLNNVKFTYHINGGEGSNRDRNKAKQLIINDFDAIEQQINEKIGRDFLFVIFSAGGGTGSGAGPMLMDLLLEDENRTVGAITVLPTTDESVRANMNAYECFTELVDIESTAATFIIDNEKGNKFSLNQDFVNNFHAFVRIPEKHKSTKGNIDRAEILETLKAKGMGVIASTAKRDTAALIQAIKENGYASFEQDRVIKYLSLSAYGEINLQELQKEVGIPLDIYQTYNTEKSICALTGLSYPLSRLEQIYEITKAAAAQVSQNIDKVSRMKMKSDINFLEPPVVREPREPEKKASKRDIMNKYLK